MQRNDKDIKPITISYKTSVHKKTDYFSYLDGSKSKNEESKEILSKKDMHVIINDSEPTIKTMDITGKPVSQYIKTSDVKQRAQRTIATLWRQYYRSKVIHRKLFGPSSLSSSRDNSINLPESFRYLETFTLPLLFPTTTHTTDTLASIMHDGVIYANHTTHLSCMSGPTDTNNFDNRMTFTSPQFERNGDTLVFSTPALFMHNSPQACYFKFCDWWLKHYEVTIDLIPEKLNMIIRRDGYGYHCQLMNMATQEIVVLTTIPAENLVFHGLQGLNQYVYLMIFQILESLPAEQATIKEEIYFYFKSLDQEALISFLTTIAKKLTLYAEIDSVNALTLSFTSLTRITTKNIHFDINELRQIILNKEMERFSDFIHSPALYPIISKSYFFASGMLMFAKRNESHEIANEIENLFAEVLSLAEVAKEQTQALNTTLFTEFNPTPIEKMTEGSHSVLVYRHTSSGHHYCIKTYKDSYQSRVEVLAARLYQAAGTFVPETLLVRHPRKATLDVASKKMPITALTPEEAQHIVGVHENFIIDAWLGNWDVAGLHFDNLNKVNGLGLRFDFGSTLHYRACGQLKPFQGTVSELTTMLDSDINKNTAAIFKDISQDDLKIGGARLKRITPEMIREQVINIAPEPHLAEDREKLIDILIARRENLINQYCLTLDDPIELIARDILGQYYQTFPLKLKHGGMHASRVAILIPIFAAKYREKGYEISDEDIKLMQIAALFHDAKRFSDTGDDDPKAERENAKLCFDYLISLGVDKNKAQLIADSICHKDSDVHKKKSIYRKLLQNVDCADVLRSHSREYRFDPSYLDYYQEFRSDQKDLDALLDEIAQFVANTGDLAQSYDFKTSPGKELKPTHSMSQKMTYERSKECYRDILTNLGGLPLLSHLYQKTTGTVIPTEKSKTPVVMNLDEYPSSEVEAEKEREQEKQKEKINIDKDFNLMESDKDVLKEISTSSITFNKCFLKEKILDLDSDNDDNYAISFFGDKKYINTEIIDDKFKTSSINN